MDYFKDRKFMGCVALIIIFILGSFFIYGERKSKVFKDEYMDDIFEVEEEGDYKADNNENTNNNSSIKSGEEQIALKKKEVTVEIKGEVKEPKVYTLPEGAIINDLINMAGGLTEEAKISNINRAKILKNEDLVVIGNKNDVENVVSKDESIGVGNEGVNSQSLNSNSTTININTAGLSELMNIEGVGEKTAQKIIDYREANGGFKSIEDIKNVDRIGEKTFEKMKEQISC